VTIIVAAVTEGGGVTVMAVKVPNSVPCCKWIQTAFADRVCHEHNYLCLCMQGSLFLNSYTSYVECISLCWKQFSLNEDLLHVVPLKKGRFVTRKCDIETFGNDIYQ
jgi:hypothetical protein